jgi:hypothetical protein
VKSKLFAAATIAGGCLAMAATSAIASSQAPAGNNGAVKIEAGPPDTTKSNEPHVSCNVYVEFWGYDAGQQEAKITFEAQSPTGSGVVLTDVATWNTPARDGGKHLDHTYGPADVAGAMQSAGIAPHPKQGYHVKLTVNVTGSQGADTKHKVFWLDPCPSYPTTSSTYAPG